MKSLSPPALITELALSKAMLALLSAAERAASRKQEAGSRKQEAGSRKQEIIRIGRTIDNIFRKTLRVGRERVASPFRYLDAKEAYPVAVILHSQGYGEAGLRSGTSSRCCLRSRLHVVNFISYRREKKAAFQIQVRIIRITRMNLAVTAAEVTIATECAYNKP